MEQAAQKVNVDGRILLATFSRSDYDWLSQQLRAAYPYEKQLDIKEPLKKDRFTVGFEKGKLSAENLDVYAYESRITLNMDKIDLFSKRECFLKLCLAKQGTAYLAEKNLGLPKGTLVRLCDTPVIIGLSDERKKLANVWELLERKSSGDVFYPSYTLKNMATAEVMTGSWGIDVLSTSDTLDLYRNRAIKVNLSSTLDDNWEKLAKRLDSLKTGMSFQDHPAFELAYLISRNKVAPMRDADGMVWGLAGDFGPSGERVEHIFRGGFGIPAYHSMQFNPSISEARKSFDEALIKAFKREADKHEANKRESDKREADKHEANKRESDKRESDKKYNSSTDKWIDMDFPSNNLKEPSDSSGTENTEPVIKTKKEHDIQRAMQLMNVITLTLDDGDRIHNAWVDELSDLLANLSVDYFNYDEDIQ